MLWRENIKSVSHRYPHESSATLPGPRDCEFVITESDFGCVLLWDHFDPAQVLKACDCFEYQSCEHDEWESSEAHAFIQSLRSSAWHALPEYDGAEWGAPKTIAEKRAEYRAKQIAERL